MAIDTPAPPNRKHEPSVFDLFDFPAFRITTDPHHPFSPAISERCFTYCSQSHRGRTTYQEPRCRTFCLRHVLPFELRRIRIISSSFDRRLPPDHPTNAGKWVPIDTPIPLSPEYRSVLGPDDPDSKSRPRQSPQDHWRAGYYLWVSRSRPATAEHLLHMRHTLHTQHNYESAKQRWARAVRDGRESSFDWKTPDAYIYNSARVRENKEALLLDPHESKLLSLSTPPPLFRSTFDKYLGPGKRAVVRIHDMTVAGGQARVAGKMYDSISRGAPVALAARLSKTMWKIVTGGIDDDDDGKDKG